MPDKPLDPAATYLRLGEGGTIAQLPGGDAFWSRPAAELDRLGRDWLVSEFACAADWPSWEMHPEGDELVYLLSGDITFLLEGDDGVRAVHLEGRQRVPRSGPAELAPTRPPACG